MIPLPLQIKITQKKDNSAVFEIEGFYPGYGVTIGNCLRRVLLSSLEGSAITQIKIKNVQHEFSTIPGVLEDVVIILLNLKKLRFKMTSPEPQIITLSAKGEREVKGKDFKLTPFLTLSNPDSYIASLTKSSAELLIEAQVERGVGYEPVERREIKKTEVGVMPLDAIFSPVKKVSFHTEDMRIGKRTDFDRLIIDIETDGTILPEEALAQTLDILVKHFVFLSDLCRQFLPQEEVIEKSGKKTKAVKQVQGLSSAEELKANKVAIEEVELSERTKNVLIKNNIKTIDGLARKPEKDLRKIDGLGDKAIGEIKKLVKKFGLSLKED